MLSLKITCPRCEGVGKLYSNEYDAQGNLISSIPEDPCSRCNGEKVIEWGCIDISDLEDKLNDILDKCNDIFEKLDE